MVLVATQLAATAAVAAAAVVVAAVAAATVATLRVRAVQVLRTFQPCPAACRPGTCQVWARSSLCTDRQRQQRGREATLRAEAVVATVVDSADRCKDRCGGYQGVLLLPATPRRAKC